MLIFGPAAGPTTSAVTWYPVSSAGSLMTVPSSTTRSAGNVTLDPASPSSLSTVSTSSRATFSCLPPQRTIAYTRELPLPCACPCPRTRCGLADEPDMQPYMQETTTGYLTDTGPLALILPGAGDHADHRLETRAAAGVRIARPPRPCFAQMRRFLMRGDRL